MVSITPLCLFPVFGKLFLSETGNYFYKDIMSEISSLTVYAVVIGSVMLGFCLAWFSFPETLKAWATAFPRNAWAGRILAAIDIALVTFLLLSEGFSWVDAHRQLVFLAVPAALFIVIFLMDELLAVRALGGLFLLIPFWILKAAFEHPSAGKLLMTCFAYLLVVKGIVLVWSPYLYRKQLQRLNSNVSFKFVSFLAGSVLGLAMIVMGLIVY